MHALISYVCVIVLTYLRECIYIHMCIRLHVHTHMQMEARLAVMLGVVVPTPGERILERQRLSIPTAAQRQARPWKDTQAAG